MRLISIACFSRGFTKNYAIANFISPLNVRTSKRALVQILTQFNFEKIPRQELVNSSRDIQAQIMSLKLSVFLPFFIFPPILFSGWVFFHPWWRPVLIFFSSLGVSLYTLIFLVFFYFFNYHHGTTEDFFLNIILYHFQVIISANIFVLKYDAEAKTLSNSREHFSFS